MIIEMHRDGDGVWIYHDITQAEICLTVNALTGWEITGFDDWINTDSHWTDTEFQGKENRNELIQLRHRLTRTFHDYHHDNYVIQLEAERLYAVAQWIASHIAGYKLAKRAQPLLDQHGKKEPKLKTKLYEEYAALHPRSNKIAVDALRLACPIGDGGMAPFFWRDRDLIERETGKRIAVCEMISQLQKARQRMKNRGK
ncbi:hypothetical protein [Polaromonas eurypsychrophila]|uniref:Uncharacterized protein n=1 Tax=Polaromonas eurypsychrophila TaxID=1614635 RepID=A0A916SKA3_9BURK|nr:hypothetical protein [Polaromonas eurypsychrophila]GGB03622.1 hypothetical protein GCM10011496_25730 [Polaromonas eurypsychrophila]